MLFLVDTGILLRVVDTLATEHQDIRNCLKALRARGDGLAVTPQNMAEFWNVSTRPTSARGGYGRSIEQTERCVRFFERNAAVIVESSFAYDQWRTLVAKHRISGVGVHDARLVAIMLPSGISHILTLNAADFARYPGVIPATHQQALGLTE